MIVQYPLTKTNRIRLARAFRDVPRVDISIECVLEDQMGAAYVDDMGDPSAYMIRIGPFHYFAGEANSLGGLEMVKGFQPYNLFMSASNGWADAFKQQYGERFIEIERYSFSSKKISIEHVMELCQSSAFAKDVKRMDAALVERVSGQEHFIDVSDFESSADFEGRGIGFYVEKDGKIIGAAYSSLVCTTSIEVSLFIEEEYRRQGIATVLSANLVHWCLEHGVDAHWDAANLESCKLAEKLGYVPTGSYQAYYLKP